MPASPTSPPLFGWQTETHHPDFESPGLIGQWVEGRRPAPDTGPVIWLAVADMDETLKQATRHGGQILEPPVPDYDVELSDGWDAVRTIVDVGGGTGAMLASLLRQHPQACGILVDLPGTVARAGELIESLGVAGRVTVEGQSFFDPLPAGADLYLLKSVLNDWPDEPTVAILRRCAEAARPSQAAIAILGGVAADEMPRSLGIDMLVAGGKTSTLSQFTGLARQAGLDVTAARTQSSGRYVVECRPAPPP